MTDFQHIPVLLNAVVAGLRPADGEVFIDATVGGGGHAAALLAAADCRVIGIDRDAQALSAARGTCASFGDRFVAVQAAFDAVGDVLAAQGLDRVHGILADLGVSSHQLDTAARGFSFRHAGPLDMRMDVRAGITAADVVNTWAQADLSVILRDYGEERHHKRLAAAIVAGRPFADTAALASAIAAATPGTRGRIHPATRAFQAIRIAVNDELGQLERFLPAAMDRLVANGRLAVITFHSLEDRMVKRFFDAKSGKGRDRDPFGNPIGPVHLALEPSVTAESEADDDNPRARSARLRVASRVPWNAS